MIFQFQKEKDQKGCRHVWHIRWHEFAGMVLHMVLHENYYMVSTSYSQTSAPRSEQMQDWTASTGQPQQTSMWPLPTSSERKNNGTQEECLIECSKQGRSVQKCSTNLALIHDLIARSFYNFFFFLQEMFTS